MLSFEWEARFDGNSELVAELVTLNGFKSAYAVKDGAEGPRGWLVCASLPLISIMFCFFKCISAQIIHIFFMFSE